MAVAVVAGLSAVGGQAITVGLAQFTLAMATKAFVLGAGLSMISRALQPKLEVGQNTGLTTSVSNPIAERPIIYGRTRTGGTIVYFTTSGSDSKFLHLVIAVAGHAIDGYEKVYFDDQVIWEDGSYVDDWVQNAQINFYDGTQTTADQDLINASNEWNSNCILNDTAYIHVRLEYDPEVYTNGIPSITTTIRGKKVYDPRTDVTEWSENPALCIYDYLQDPKYGLNDDTVNLAQVIASANVCDQLVTIDTDVDQTRYALSGFISTGDTVKANIEKMLSSMFGRLVCTGGELFINAGYYTLPVLDIDESMLVGEVSLQTKTSRRNTYNAVKGTFLSEEENYIFADYPSIKSDTYSTEDGEPLYLDLPLPCTTNNVRAQRLAKLSLNKSRQQRTLSIPVNLAGLKVRAGDVIRFTSERLGISNAEYEVIDFEFEYSDQLIVNLVCVETGASLYDWTVADKLDFSVGSDITLYDGTAIAPTGLTATAVSNILSDGTDSTYIDVAWTNPSDIYFDYVVLKYGDQSIVTKDQTYRINNVDENTQYTITISAYNTFGRQSTGLSTNVTTVRDTTAPANITSITATGGLQSIDLSWTNPSDDDFDLVRIKVASTNVEPASHSYEVRADNFIDDVGAYSATRYYWLAPVDRTGNVGNYVSGGSATTGSIDYGDINNPPTIPEVATTAYLTLGDNDAPTDVEFNTAVGRDPINNDFVVVNKEFAFTYNGTSWDAVTEFIDGSLLVSGSISASDITTGTLNANDVTVTNLSGESIKSSTAVTVGTSNNVAVLSGSDATYRLWAGDATSADAPFKVSQTGVLYATGAEISGNITAGSIDAENITFTGSLIADGLSNIPNVEALNMTQSLRNAIEEIIVTKFGSDASTGYFDEVTGTFDINDDDTEICKISNFDHNGSPIDIDLTFSKIWQTSASGTPSVVVNIQRSPVGAGTWTTIKTETVTGLSVYDPEVKKYIARISGVVSVSDNPAVGDYDYRFLTGDVFNLATTIITARLEANEQGEQIGTIDLANYGALAQDETITGDWTFSGKTIHTERTTDSGGSSAYVGSGTKLYEYLTNVATEYVSGNDEPVTIYFKSGVNAPSDFAYITYDPDYDDSGENGALVIGSENDGTGSSDYVRIQSRLVIDSNMHSSDSPYIAEFYSAGVQKGYINTSGNLQLDGTISASGYNDSNWNTAHGWGDHANAGYLKKASLGQIGDSDVTFGSTNNWANNPVAGFYKTDYVGYSGLVFMSGDVGGSTSSIGMEFSYSGDFYIHSNTDSNQWTSHKVWTSKDISTTNVSNWNTAYTYSQVGHLPLAGGTLSGDLNTGIGNYFGRNTSYHYKPYVTGGIGTRSELLSHANFLIHADTDGSGASEFVSIRAGAGTANELKLLSKTEAAGVSNEALTLNGNKVFNDAYHPNADKWTTARTLSLTGDVTGSVSWDGSDDASITTTVADDSHSHSNYLPNSGTVTHSGLVSFTGTGSTSGIRFNSATVANDAFGIRVNGTSNDGELEFYSTDDDTEPFVFRHYTTGQDGTGSNVEWARISNLGLGIKGTTVIDASLNLTNIGSITSGGINTSYGIKFLNGATDFLMYNNTGNNVLYLRDTTNGAMITTWSTTKFTVDKILNVSGNIEKGGQTIVDASRNLTNIATVNANSLTIDGGAGFGEYHSATQTLTVNTSWQNTSIASSTLATGTWAVSVYFYSSGAYLETYTGIMQWYGSGTNDNDANEIVLHHAGHADNGPSIYLRTLRRYSSTMVLQIASSSAISSTTYTMKFRRLI